MGSRSVSEVASELDVLARELELRVSGRESIPAPELYDVLGNLKWTLGHRTDPIMRSLARGLQASLDTHDVTDTGGEPSESADAAASHLREAANLATQIGQCLEAAQTAIAGQGYRTSDDG